ncbi:MAG TPA: DinB family protein, partial [Vicinamibacteria bacterium]|nr:DinB family protein [Vicinamibacteria bacterium]
PEVAPLLQPVAHALLQVGDDVRAAVAGLTPEQLWARPGGAASVGFHLMHLAGSLDRLLTYARGAAGLDEAQRQALAAERTATGPEPGLEALLEALAGALESSLRQVRETPAETLLDPRAVGRAGSPSTVLGLLFHAAEHATRHAGQVITTVKFVQATQPSDSRA